MNDEAQPVVAEDLPAVAHQSRLPKGWQQARLGEVLPLEYGKALPEKTRTSGGTVRVFGSSGEVGTHTAAYMDGPAIIVGRKGNVGSVYYSSGPCWPIDTVYFASGTPVTHLRFFCHQVSFLNLRGLDKSTAVPGLSRDDYNRVAAVVPPLSEQRRIVATIEDYFSRLDEAVDLLVRVQRNLKRYRASVLKAAVEGRLVPTEAELARAEGRTYEPASALLQRILVERRRRWEQSGRKGVYQEPVAPDTTDLPELPEGWCWTSIRAICECLDSQRVPVNKKERLNAKGSVPYYGANGRVGWIDKPLFNEPLILVVEDETFIGREKPFSYLIDGPSWVNNHAHVLRPSAAVTPGFLNSALAFYPFTPLTTGTTGRRKLTQAALMGAPLALPPLAEQVRIEALVERHFSLADSAESATRTSLLRSARLRQSILKWAFEGRLADQDPTDEPASVLLERIRAERAASSTGGRQRTRRASARRGGLDV